jgi:hypothetical protein
LPSCGLVEDQPTSGFWLSYDQTLHETIKHDQLREIVVFATLKRFSVLKLAFSGGGEKYNKHLLKFAYFSRIVCRNIYIFCAINNIGKLLVCSLTACRKRG